MKHNNLVVLLSSVLRKVSSKTLLCILSGIACLAACACVLPQLPILNGSMEIYSEEGEKLKEGESADVLLSGQGMNRITFRFRFWDRLTGTQENYINAEKCTDFRNGNSN